MNKKPNEEYKDLKEEILEKYNNDSLGKDDLKSMIHGVHKISWHWGYSDAIEESDPYFDVDGEHE